MTKKITFIFLVLMLSACQSVSVKETPNLYRIAELLVESGDRCVKKSGFDDRIGKGKIQDYREIQVAVNKPNWFKAKFEKQYTTGGGYVYGYTMINIKNHKSACGSMIDNIKHDRQYRISEWRAATELDAYKAIYGSDEYMHSRALNNEPQKDVATILKEMQVAGEKCKSKMQEKHSLEFEILKRGLIPTSEKEWAQQRGDLDRKLTGLEAQAFKVYLSETKKCADEARLKYEHLIPELYSAFDGIAQDSEFISEKLTDRKITIKDWLDQHVRFLLEKQNKIAKAIEPYEHEFKELVYEKLQDTNSLNNSSATDSVFVYENSTAVVKIHGEKGFIKVKSDGKFYENFYDLVSDGRDVEVGYFVDDRKFKPKRYDFDYKTVRKLKAREKDGVREIIAKDENMVADLISKLDNGHYLYLSGKDPVSERFGWWRLERR